MPKLRDLSADSFGARLAAYRQTAGYTQVELARLLGISQRMLSHYEGLPDHSLARLLRLLSEKLGVSTDELLAAGKTAKSRVPGKGKAAS